MLDDLRRGGDLELHPSKTSGDYMRELRRRGSPVVHDFRVFGERPPLFIGDMAEDRPSVAGDRTEFFVTDRDQRQPI